MVKLNEDIDRPTIRQPFYPYGEIPKSSLTHASEKAMESYFHLYHLLLCMATDHPELVSVANEMVTDFANGAVSLSPTLSIPSALPLPAQIYKSYF